MKKSINPRKGYHLTDKGIALVNGHPEPPYPNGTRVTLMFDMPDEITPLYAGDSGEVVVFEDGLSGFRSDRHRSISISRLLQGKKIRVLDFCLLDVDVSKSS